MKPEPAANSEPGVTLAYMRVSDKKQDLDRQFAVIDRMPAENGWRVEEFADYDEDSEIPLDLRAGFPKSKAHTEVGKKLAARGLLARGGRQMLERLRRGGVVRIWIPELDRLGRSPFVLSSAFNEIEKYDPRPIIVDSLGNDFSLKDNPDKILATMVSMGMASAEKVRIRKRTMEGAEVHRDDPYWHLGGPPGYGYEIDRQVKGTRTEAYRTRSEKPTTGNSRLPSQVAVVRMIYKMVRTNATCRKVSDYLNLQRIPAACRKEGAARQWTPGRLRNLVKDPIYKGVVVRNREVYREPDDPFRKPHIRPKPRDKWRELSAPKLAIVTEKEWDEAQAALSRNLSLAKQREGNRHYALVGLVHCEYCHKHNFVGTTIHGDVYYRCRNRGASYDPDGHRCDAPHIRGDYLERLLLTDIANAAINPDPFLLAAVKQSVDANGPDRSFGEEIVEAKKSLARLSEERMEYHRQRGRQRIRDSEFDRLIEENAAEETEWQRILRDAEGREANARRLEVEIENGRDRLLRLQKRARAGKLTVDDIRAVVRRVYISRGAITIDYSFQNPAYRWGAPGDEPTRGDLSGGGSTRSPKAETVTRSCRRPGW